MASASLARSMMQRAARSFTAAAVAGPSSSSRCACQMSARRLLHSAPTITQEPQTATDAPTQAQGRSGAQDGAVMRMWGVSDKQKTTKKQATAVEEPFASEETASSEVATSSSTSATSQQEPSDSLSPTYMPFSFANPPRIAISDFPGEKRRVCTVKLSCYHADLQNLVFFAKFVEHVAAAFGLPYHRARPLPVKTSLRTVPRSPFVHKPAQENFIKKVHARTIDIYNSDMDSVKQFIEYISENGMSNVRMQVRLYERKELGFGKQMLEVEAGDLEKTDEQKVKEIAQGILETGFAEAHAESSAGGNQIEQTEPQQLQTEKSHTEQAST